MSAKKGKTEERKTEKLDKDEVKIEEKKDEVLELKNQLARALADYDNLTKRSESERETWIKFGSERILNKLVSVLDVFNSAQEHLKDQGLGIAIGEFQKVLKEEGLEEIKPSPGEVFDENYHEAIEAIENGEKGKIAELVLSGWRFEDGPVIRVAKVKVFN